MPIEVFATAHLETRVGNELETSRSPVGAVLRMAVGSRQTVLPPAATMFRYDAASGRWLQRGGPGHWLLAETEVGAACGVRVKRRLETADTLSAPVTRPARRCGS